MPMNGHELMGIVAASTGDSKAFPQFGPRVVELKRRAIER